MAGAEGGTSIRERTRQAVRAELTQVAQELFARDGFQATTIDDVLAATGVSRRTFFRYFSSKDDLVLGKYEVFGERMVEALRARPADEPVWQSLRATFDVTLVYFQDGPDRRRNDAMERIVHSSPALHAGYLERTARTQQLLAEVISERLTGQDAALRATVVVGAAFACLQAVHQLSLTEPGRPAAEMLDAAMATITPEL